MRRGCLDGLRSCLFGLGLVTLLLAAGYASLGRNGTIERALPTEVASVVNRLATSATQLADETRVNLRGVRSVPVPILTYHYIREVTEADDPVGYRLSVPTALLAAQLDALQETGYTTVTPRQFLAGQIDETSVILSFDDGYRDFYTEALPMLRTRGLVAVVFVVAGFLDDSEGRYLTSDYVNELAKAGMEIGSHTLSHANLATASPEALQSELVESRFTLEKLTEDRVVSVAYPSGEYSNEVVAMAEFAGYRLGVTTEPGVARLADPHLTLPRLAVRPSDTPEQLVARIREAKQQPTDQTHE